MNIISHAAQAVQPKTTFRVEERTIDADGNTVKLNRVLNAHDRDSGWDLFRQQLTLNPDKYKSGKGRRLVLVEGGGDR